MILLKVNAHRGARRKLWLTAQKPSIAVDNYILNFLTKHAVDMLVYARTAPTNMCPEFEKIAKNLRHKKFFIAREFDHYPWRKTEWYIDLSLQKCGTFGEIQTPFQQNHFWLSTPTPGEENRCDGIPFIIEEAVPGMQERMNDRIRRAMLMNKTFEYVCNGTVPSEAYRDFFYSNRIHQLWTSRNRQYFQSRNDALCKYNDAPRVFWAWNISQNCSTMSEAEEKIRTKFQGRIDVELLIGAIRNISWFMPPQKITPHEIVSFMFGDGSFSQSSSCFVKSGVAGAFGFGAGFLSGTLFGAKIGFKAGYAAGKFTSFWNLLGNLFQIGKAIFDTIDDIFDGLTDQNACPKCDHQACPESSTMMHTTSFIAEVTSNISETHREDEPKQRGSNSREDPECFFKNKDNLVHRKALAQESPCGTTDNEKKLVSLWDIAEQDTVHVEFGAYNEADLILARGAGLFLESFGSGEDEEFLKANFVCEKHRKEFGRSWYETTKRKLRRKKDRVEGTSCDLPNIGTDPVEMASHGERVAFARNQLNREQAKHLVERKNTFAAVGQRKDIITSKIF